MRESTHACLHSWSLHMIVCVCACSLLLSYDLLVEATSSCLLPPLSCDDTCSLRGWILSSLAAGLVE